MADKKPRRDPEMFVLAPRDERTREIQTVLKLIEPDGAEYVNGDRFEGYCGAAAEAYLYLAGGKQSGLHATRRDNRGEGSHWWLERDDGNRIWVIDLNLDSADRKRLKEPLTKHYPYHRGKRAMFRRGYAHPSERAAAIINLVKLRRAHGRLEAEYAG